MLNLTPANLRFLAIVAGGLLLCALSASGGAAVATWRAELACATKVGELEGKLDILRDQKHELELAIAEQNKAVAVAEAQTRGAEQAKALAQQHADDMASFSKSRMDKLERFMADTSEQVLKAYWELRK